MKLNLQLWLKFSLLNLCLVALLGLIMRSKISFGFIYFDFNYLLHSHSHFAFSGWITHTIMTLMIFLIQDKISNSRLKTYKAIIIANLVCSYGMLIFFILQGYGMISIIFSTGSIFVSYAFGFYYWKDLKKLDSNLAAINWFRAAVLFNIISSMGTFYLAFMMATKSINEDLKLASIHYFLHFQYNGWFFFGCMGLLFWYLNIKKTDNTIYDIVFKLFAIVCAPAYILSLLWLHIPGWVNVLAIMAAVIQVLAWFKLLVVLIQTYKHIFKNTDLLLRSILIFACVALSIKFILQLGSTIPYFSQIASSFRPIVIAYLHLVLLAVISLFLLCYIYTNHFIMLTKKIKVGLLIFSLGVFLNELVLALQGLLPFNFPAVPNVNMILFGVAMLLLIGITIITYFSIKNKYVK